MARNYISACISTCGEILLAENKKLATHAVKSIELIINYTIEPALWQKTSAFSQGLFAELTQALTISDQKGPTNFQRVVIVMNHFLSSRYDTVQHNVASIMGAFFERLELSCQEYTKDLVCEFVSRRSQWSYDLWESTLGKYIQRVGPQLLLQYYPLRILDFDLIDEEYEEKSSSWMLPLLKKYMKVNSIKLFFDYLLPIAQKIKEAFDNKMIQSETQSGRLYEILYIQIWELFPRFCRFTKENLDITAELFHMSTQMLTHASRDALKHVFKGLENIVGYILKLPKYSNNEMIRAQRSIQEQADKFVPMLCKAYITNPGVPKNILNLIRAMAFLCSQAYLERIYTKNIQKLIEDKSTEKLKNNILIRAKEADLLIQIAEAMELKDSKYDAAMKFVKTFLDDDTIIQKKAYRLVCILMNKVHSSFLQNIFSLLQEFKSASQSSKATRLQCIEALFAKYRFSPETANEIMSMTQELLPEILLAGKEANKKCRKAAISLLISVSEKFAENGMGEHFIGMVGYLTQTRANCMDRSLEHMVQRLL